MNRTVIITSALAVAAFGAGLGIRASADGDSSSSSPITQPPVTMSGAEPGPATTSIGEPPPAESVRPMTDDAMPDTMDGSTNQCVELEAELVRREEFDLIDWETLEEGEELSEEELEMVLLPAEPVGADIVDPAAPSILDADVPTVDLGSITDRDLLDAVEVCYEFGVLTEPPDDEEEFEEDEPEEDEPDEDEFEEDEFEDADDPSDEDDD